MCSLFSVSLVSIWSLDWLQDSQSQTTTLSHDRHHSLFIITVSWTVWTHGGLYCLFVHVVITRFPRRRIQEPVSWRMLLYTLHRAEGNCRASWYCYSPLSHTCSYSLVIILITATLIPLRSQYTSLFDSYILYRIHCIPNDTKRITGEETRASNSQRLQNQHKGGWILEVKLV